MKLRRRILKYFIVLIVLTILINIVVSYYTNRNSLDRLHDIYRKAFLQKTAENAIQFYHVHGSFNGISEADIRPREVVINQPRRWIRQESRDIAIPLAGQGGEYILLADDQGRFILGGEKAKSRKKQGYPLKIQGKSIGTLWLVPIENNFWQAASNILLVPLIIRSMLTVLIASTLAFGTAFIFSEYLMRHIGELARAARRIAKGDLDCRLQTSGRDELADLALDFNSMAEKLQEDQRLRRQLQADVVHELRTPLAVYQAVLDSLENGVIRWDAGTLASLQEETARMNRLVADLHELSRAENQQLPLYKELFSLGDLMVRLQESFGELARKKEIDFALQVDDSVLDTVFYADPDRTMQIFLNILHNALRHTPQGGSITMRAWAKERNMMAISVTDTGEGISAEHLPHVFDRFFCSDKSRSRRRGGTGLGLAIAKEYTILHGGSIEVKSSLGQGSEFTVFLPVERQMDD
jgi:two-component system sensor histidine kinase BaeS